MAHVKPSVVVFDYGSGNLRSAARALEHAGADVTVTADTAAAVRAHGLVVPGVGAFASCMDGIRSCGGDKVIAERRAAATPVLGICVGAQILFDAGTEHGTRTTGLGVFDGEVTALRAERVPHMGWNTVDQTGMPLFEGLAPDARFYFVHSYAVHGTIPGAQVATCDYGDPFVAAISRDTVSATQFHPEKSGSAGLTLLSNWVRSL
nr:imidazole glycerol phosphate synthase subunit HisH [Stackebrandtia nassauensis]